MNNHVCLADTCDQAQIPLESVVTNVSDIEVMHFYNPIMTHKIMSAYAIRKSLLLVDKKSHRSGLL